MPMEARPLRHARLIEQLVRAAFGQRRKTLSNALRDFASATQMRAVDIDPGDRAEQLAPAAFVRLAGHLAQAQDKPESRN